MAPKVSVLMSVYRTKESYLRTAIESILHQTFTYFEFLILDDCPNDSREDIVKSYQDPRIKYFKNEKNLGITPSRNKLIKMSQGEYLATMDHDDISLPTRFEKQVAYLDKHKNTGVVGCLEESFPKYAGHYYPEKDEEIKAALTYTCAISHPGSMMRKSVLIKNNIEYEERYSPAEDYRLWLRLMECTDFYNIQEVLFRYRYYEHNTSHRQIEKMLYVGEELRYLAQKKHPDLYAKFQKNKKYKWTFFGKIKLPILIHDSKVRSQKASDCVDLSVCAIVKNEAPYIKEWLDYHLLAGVKRFYIYDNESIDNLKKVLSPYIKSNTVVYKYYPGKKKQLSAYKNCIKKYKTKTEWLAFIDCDEFILPIEKNTIPEFLEEYKEFPGVCINWMIFDSNNHMIKPKGGVLENYVRVHQNDQELVNHHVKCIVRPEMVKRIRNPHSCEYLFKQKAVTENKVELDTSLTEIVSFNKIRINHYFSKSKEEYLAKVNRGRADTNQKRSVNEADYIFSETKQDTKILTYLQKIKH